MHTDQTHKFIIPADDLARLINDRANHLYQKLAVLDISDTEIDDFGKHYFNSHHGGRRLFFSVQSSADIIYHSVKKSNKEISELNFIDYGAGLGTLFLLAGAVGFKQVYFNDYFPQWAGYARIICNKLDIPINDFISGDIDSVIEYSKVNNIHFDIVASRNVVEHIYKLRDFYTKLYQSGITSVCYATTTANYHNIAMRLKHYWHHYQVEKTAYKKQRVDYIKELVPAVNDADLTQLLPLTRGRAFADFTGTIDLYFKKQPIPPVEFLSTNTCDCRTGVWAENLITRKNYLDIIQSAGFTASYTAGFWDTNYKYAVVNLLARALNRMINIFGAKGYWFAPFVNIVASKEAIMNNTIKVLSLVSYKFLPPDMGGQKGIAFFNRYLSKTINLRCVTIKENDIDHSEGYPVENILSNSRLRYINPFYFFTLSRIIRENKITHLIIEHPYYGWLGYLLKWFCKVQLIVHSHNIESLRFKTMDKWWWGILWHYEKFTHGNADLNFFIHDDDRNYAIENFKLSRDKCVTITYGFEYSAVPGIEEKKSARQLICKTHQLAETDKLLLFNGTLGYKPNLDAVISILEKINPLLLAETNFNYKIIICGNKLPTQYKGLIDHKDKNIIYAGFVEDINLYFKGSDIFINPVTDGGGIKTKLVEALGYDLSVISSRSGATGIPVDVMGDKMKIVEDGNWPEFARQIIAMNTSVTTPPDFFDHFYWGNIARKAREAING